MAPEDDRLDRANQLFSDALELPATERPSFVQRECAGDAALCDSVLRLLVRFENLGSFLETPAGGGHNELSPGDLLDGRFRVVELLGRGGMGEVYRADDLTLGEPVALKMVRAEWRSDPAMLARFHDEVRLARRISHPNVCRVFGFRTCSIGGRDLAFFEMEYLDGDSLAKALATRGKFDAASVLRIAGGMAAGLDAAHREGVIHRDLKPGNIFLARDRQGHDRTVITDFGLARSVEGGDGTHTQSGMLAGSPDYMAPEQYLGQELTTAVDIFAFGLIVYEMAAGRRPYPPESIVRSAVRRIMEAPPPLSRAVPDCPRHWDRVLSRALAREPDRRCPTAGALVRELEERPSAVTAAFAAVRVPQVSRRAWIVGAGAAGVSVASYLGVSRLYKRTLPDAPLIMLTPLTSASPANAAALDLQIEKGLLQSAHVRVLDRGRIHNAWKRMARPGEMPAHLGPVDAREIALREKADFVLSGNLGWANGEWVLRAGLQRLGSGPSLPRYEKTNHFYSNDERGLLSAAAQAVDWVRRTVGETESEIGAHDRAPDEVTTSSWEALKEYTAAISAWSIRPVDREWPPDQREAAEGHLLRALEIDPRFAQAWAKLADFQMASYEFDKALLSYARAAQLIDERNLTDRESLMIRGMFALDTGQYAKGEQVFSRLSIEYPKDGLPLFYEARAVECQGRLEASLHLLDMAVKKDPHNYSFVIDRAIHHLALEHLTEAERDCKRAAGMNDTDWTDQMRSALAFAHLDIEGTRAALRHMQATGSVAYRSKAFALEACLLAEQDKSPEAQSLLEDGLRFDLSNNLPPQVHIEKKLLLAGVLLRQNRPGKAVETCRGILEAQPGIWSTLDSGAVLARAGDVHGAQACLPAGVPRIPPEQVPQGLPQGVPKELLDWPIYWRRILRLWGEIALATGRPQNAFALLQAAPPPESILEWPDALVRASIESGERRTAAKLLAALFRNPAAYWIAAEVNCAGFVRQAIAQAKVLGMPGTLWSPVERFLSQSN